MKRIRAQHDIKSISEFRANAATLIEQVQQDNHPLILTQHGNGAAVLLSVVEYDRLLDEILNHLVLYIYTYQYKDKIIYHF